SVGASAGHLSVPRRQRQATDVCRRRGQAFGVDGAQRTRHLASDCRAVDSRGASHSDTVAASEPRPESPARIPRPAVSIAKGGEGPRGRITGRECRAAVGAAKGYRPLTHICYRGLDAADLDRIGEIDRTERIETMYVQRGTRLEEREGDWSAL